MTGEMWILAERISGPLGFLEYMQIEILSKVEEGSSTFVMWIRSDHKQHIIGLSSLTSLLVHC